MELERLIETEQRNDDLVRRARVDAAAIVGTAREAAQRREAAFASELQQIISANAAAIALERDQRIAAVVAAARDAVARYAAVTDAQIAPVAQALLDDLIADRRAM